MGKGGRALLGLQAWRWRPYPAGVVNIITGNGEVGSALVRHPDVRRIGFVGSVPTGRAIAKEAAATLKRVSLELGGKNPIVIFPDADPKKAAVAAIKGMNMNRQGQSCSSTSRVFVHSSLHRSVVTELVSLAEALAVGVPWLKQNDVGPIVSPRQFHRIMDFIKSAKEEGAHLLTGGGNPLIRRFPPACLLRRRSLTTLPRRCASVGKRYSGQLCR
jgi:betaine-aldehyde dehydrogenase